MKRKAEDREVMRAIEEFTGHRQAAREGWAALVIVLLGFLGIVGAGVFCAWFIGLCLADPPRPSAPPGMPRERVKERRITAEEIRDRVR